MVVSTLILAAGGEDASLAHVLDKDIIGPNSPWAALRTHTPYLSMKTVTMALAFLLLIWLVKKAARSIETGPESQGNERYVTKGRLAQMVEFLVLALRDNFVKPQLGDKTNVFMPFLMTVFFFILINNMIGMVPLLDIQHLIGGWGWGDSHFAVIGGVATGSIAVTAALATIAFLYWNYHGIREQGIGGWLKHLTAGAPVFVAPLMVVVELMGLVVKPAALAIRLFANMTAGHILLAVLLGFVGTTVVSWTTAPVAAVSFAGSLAIFFLEVFVAFLQAFIFFFLTTLFIAQLMHHEHHDEIHEGHATPFDAEHPTVKDPAIPVSIV